MKPVVISPNKSGSYDLTVSPDELYFGSKWVECVAAVRNYVICGVYTMPNLMIIERTSKQILTQVIQINSKSKIYNSLMPIMNG
jgi:hypothetical protein